MNRRVEQEVDTFRADFVGTDDTFSRSPRSGFPRKTTMTILRRALRDHRSSATTRHVTFAMAFVVLSGASAYAAVGAQNTLVAVFLIYVSISLALVGGAYAWNRPSLLLKDPSGQIFLPGRIIFFPYHALSYLSLALQRMVSKEEPFSWVSDSVVLGRLPLQADRASLGSYGVRSVLDLTAEFGAARFVREVCYLNLPLLDGTAPSLQQLRASVSWINPVGESAALHRQVAVLPPRAGEDTDHHPHRYGR